MKKALNIITKKNLGTLIAINNKKFTTGILLMVKFVEKQEK